MRKCLVAVLTALALVTVVTACTPSDVVGGQCLDRSSIITLHGPQDRYPRSVDSVPDGSTIDATDASWAILNPYPVTIGAETSENRDDVCLLGGHVTSLNGPGTLWETWHDTAGLVVKRPSFQLVKAQLYNVGDGVRFPASATNWRIQGVRIAGVHDDCIENDRMHSGVIDDSLFDGCFVFYSARGPAGSQEDGSDNLVTVTNSLVRLEPMTFSDVNGGAPGHGPLFKTSAEPLYGRSPQFEIRNTIFRFDQEPSGGAHLAITGYDPDGDGGAPPISYLDPAKCSNNTIVWLGAGPFPGRDFPSCFTVTTDPAVWNNAVAQWEATH